MRAGLVQLCSGCDPGANLGPTRDLVARAARAGAEFVTTPEVTNIVSASSADAGRHLRHEDDDPTLAALRDDAARLGIWLHVGSLALRTDDADGRFANRAFVIGPDGAIAARYDKIHMFDVSVSPEETYRESDRYRPGTRATLARTPLGALGVTICYDLRFPHLYRDLARAGAEILLVPSAFSTATGPAHWQPLLQARAIETGCYVLAAAQTGTHVASDGTNRRTHGHSLAVSPWGEVMAEIAEGPGIALVDVDVSRVAEARARVPSLGHDRPYEAP